MSITVYYAPATTTGVNCGSGTPVVSTGSAITCVATVTRSAGTLIPSGNVSWSVGDGDSGSFGSSTCSGLGASLTCTAQYTPSARGDGTHSIIATYTGDNEYAGSNGSQNVTVNIATPTLSITNPSVVYTGSEQPANLVARVNDSSVPGTFTVYYNGVATVPTNAGTYTVTADFVPTDTGSYATLNRAAAGSFVIQPASPTLSVSNTPVTYTGGQQNATVTASFGGANVPGSFTVYYNGLTTAPTNVGTYTVTADFTSASGNFTSLVNASAGSFVIHPAAPTLTVTNSPVTYNAAQQAAQVTATFGGQTVPGALTVYYNGVTDVPTNASTYVVTANFVPESGNFATLTGVTVGSFQIQPATPTLTLTNSPVTFNNTGQAAVVTATLNGQPADGTVTPYYNGDPTAPTNAASYTVTADFTPGNTNFAPVSSAVVGTFVIQPAAPALTMSNSTVTYTGAQQNPTVTASFDGANVPGTPTLYFNGLSTAPTNAGTYAVTADFAPTSGNFSRLTDVPLGSFEIQPAAPILSLTNPLVTFTGAQQNAVLAASFGAEAVEGSFTVYYDGFPTAPTNVGTYAVTADFTSSSTNFARRTDVSVGSFEIQPATPVLTITNSPVTYTGAQQSAMVTVTFGGQTVPGALTLSYDGSTTAPTNATDYTVTADFVPESNNFATLDDAPVGTFCIQPAAPTLTITNSPVTYNNTRQNAVVTVTFNGQPVDGSVTLYYNGSPLAPMDAGSYPVTANFTPGSANFAPVSGSTVGTFVIQPAAVTLAVTNSPATYTGAQQSATVTASFDGATVPGAFTLFYNNSATAPTNAGTYAVTGNFTPQSGNYAAVTGGPAGSFEIRQAKPTLSISNSPVTYNGAPRSATVAASLGGSNVPGTFTIYYGGSTTAPMNANTYAVTADFVPADTTNFASLTGASAGSFVIEKATPTLSVTNSPVMYDGQPHAAVVQGSVGGAVSNILYNDSTMVPTNAGTYQIKANFTPTDTTNYNSLTEASAGSFIINSPAPSLTLVKTANRSTFFKTGDVITFTYVLTNSGEAEINGPFTVTDDMANVTCPATTALAPDASVTCTASYTITDDDVTAGSVTSAATGYGVYNGAVVASNTDDVTIILVAYKTFFPIIIR